MAVVVALAVALGGAAAAAPAAGAVDRSAHGELSARLAVLAKTAVHSAAPPAQAEELSLPLEGPGSIARLGNRVLAEVRFEDRAVAASSALRAAGARVVNVSRRFQTITVAVRPAELGGLNRVPGVAGITEVLEPIASSTCPAGVAVSEGDVQLRAAELKSPSLELDGAGVEVGILSDSFDRDTGAVTNAGDDVESGDLPGPGNTCPGQSSAVDVLEDTDDESVDEGRAMAQIVHDLAPGAELSFATAFTGLTAFAENIEALADGGANVIVDDVSYFAEPFFQEGPVGVAVANVKADGVSYFSSAGNNNLINEGEDIASWEVAQFRDSGGCPGPLAALPEFEPDHCLDFNPGPDVDTTFGITVAKGRTLSVDLQWAEPWQGVDSDVDVFLLNADGEIVAGSIEDNVFGSQQPFEFLAWENSTGKAADMRLVINRYSGDLPRLKFALLQNGGGVSETEYESSLGGDLVGPTIFGHNGAESAISIGAIRYDTLDAPQGYSSRGPVTHYFGAVDGSTPAAPLSTPRVLSKPDLTATDCGANTFFGFFATVWRFCGTSAAAPHVAAVAALLLQEEPLATPDEIKAAFQEGAAEIGEFGPCAVGAGVVDAVAARELLLEPEAVSAPDCAPPVSGPWEVVDQGGDVPAEIPVSSEPVSTVPAPQQLPLGPADRVAPQTFIRRHPRKLIRTRFRRGRAVFVFRASERGALFLCQFDRKRRRRCGPRFVRWFRPGRHVLRVTTRDAAGNVDRTPAVYRFRVRRVGK